MHIDALLHNFHPRVRLRSVVEAPASGTTHLTLHFSDTWPELLARAEEGVSDLAIVDPWNEGPQSPSLRNLGPLLERVGRDRVILGCAAGEMPDDAMEALLAEGILNRLKEIQGEESPGIGPQSVSA